MNQYTENQEALDELRKSIDEEHRFETVFRGYDKAAVRTYIEDLRKKFDEVRAMEQAELVRLREENGILRQNAEDQENRIQKAREEEKQKLEGELSLKEGLIAGLQESNGRLTEENHSLRLANADLQSKNEDIAAKTLDERRTRDAIDKQMEDLLFAKLNEVKGLIGSWKEEQKRTIEKT